MPATIQYVRGDLAYPVGGLSKIVVNFCNDIGTWFGIFAQCLAARWRSVKSIYLQRFQTSSLPLGSVQFILVEKDLFDVYVANVVVVRGSLGDGIETVDLPALTTCLSKVREKCAGMQEVMIHFPHWTHGDIAVFWADIIQAIDRELLQHGIPVKLYRVEI